MKLKCNLCTRYQKTDLLWLRTIKGRDYLVCAYHREDNHDHFTKHCQTPKKQMLRANEIQQPEQDNSGNK